MKSDKKLILNPICDNCVKLCKQKITTKILKCPYQKSEEKKNDSV